MSNMKQTPSSIDAPSKEFLDQRDVELELMDSNGWHPRLRVKDQTNIDRMLAAGSISLHQWVAGTELAAWAYSAYGSLGNSMSNLDKPVGGSNRGFVSQSELNARQSLDQTRRHVIEEEGEESWDVVESVAIYDKSIRAYCRDANKTNRNAVANALRSGLSSAFNLIRDDYHARKRV